MEIREWRDAMWFRWDREESSPGWSKGEGWEMRGEGCDARMARTSC